jgi:hypothetical protein
MSGNLAVVHHSPDVAGSGITFEARGVRQLKGVPGSWQLLAVTG